MPKLSAYAVRLDWQAASLAAGRALNGVASFTEGHWKAHGQTDDHLVHTDDAVLAAWLQRWPFEEKAELLPDKMDEYAKARGRIDARMALLRFHDTSRHRVLLAALNAQECELLEIFEPLRCQRIAMSLAAGVEINLLGLWGELLGKTAFALRTSFTRLMLAILSPPQRKTLIQNTFVRLNSADVLQIEKFAALAGAVNDQNRFSELLTGFARSWTGSPTYPSECQLPVAKTKTEMKATTVFSAKQTAHQTDAIQQNIKPDIKPDIEPSHLQDKKDDGDREIGKQRSLASPARELQFGTKLAKVLSGSEVYRVFWSGGDRILRPENLVTHKQMTALWGKFGKQHLKPDNTARNAAKLRRHLLGLNLRSIEPDQEEGWPNPNALCRLITTPGFEKVFQRECESRHPRIAFTILLDCSGSMKGKPMHVAAHCTDGLIRVLERANLTVELLGFTTRSRGDGPALIRWRQIGSPPQPGRLNETLHLLFKSVYEPWQCVCHRLGALFEPSWLMENLDGEALAWAAARLLLRSEPRKILLVISDGAPLDCNTAKNNPAGYLEAHLQSVISNIAKTPIELAAIGLNYNIHRYYPNAVRLGRLEEFDIVLFKWVERLIRKMH